MSKVWLVTGCSRGLGRAIAETLLEAGDRLVATARSTSDLAFLRASDRLRTLALDVTDARAAQAAVNEAVSAFGRLDVVVNNAGFIRANSIEDEPEDEFRRQFEINFFGAYHLAHAALPVMHAQRDGHIILVASIGARRATPGLGAYQPAKAAVGAFSEVLAKEVAPLGIRVTCVEPGGMRTDMFGVSMLSKALKPDYEPTIGRTIRSVFGNPQAATSDPQKVARAILRVSQEREPPVRLLLGSDAVRSASAALADRARADEQWKELSVSTDFG
jgi:NAD(P)-dependent dehydrogenase (short-subunit alcohol dehydrogenase family)